MSTLRMDELTLYEYIIGILNVILNVRKGVTLNEKMNVAQHISERVHILN